MNIDINSAWNLLDESVKNCRKCKFCASRKQPVLGEGPRENFKFVLIGEAPGENEDIQGRPFVGKSGELLNEMMKHAKISRDDVYITNVVKCRPPGNKTPEKPERFACLDFLEAQLLLLRPSIIVTMGNPATQTLLNTSQGITMLRGNWVTWRGIDLLPMFHPSFLMRSEENGNYTPRNQTYGDFITLSEKLQRS